MVVQNNVTNKHSYVGGTM